MNIVQASIIFALSLMDKTNHNMPYDFDFVKEVATAIASVTQDPAEIETLIKISRYESGGFRKDVYKCKVKGDKGKAHGLFQVHPWSRQQAKDLCSQDITKQAAVALERVRDSIRMCQRVGRKGSDLLGGYTSGKCSKNNRAAKLRWGTGKTIEKMISKDDS